MPTSSMIQRDIDAVMAALPSPAKVEMTVRRLTSLDAIEVEMARAMAEPGVSILTVQLVADA
jgi:hypothetical protein